MRNGAPPRRSQPAPPGGEECTLQASGRPSQCSFTLVCPFSLRKPFQDPCWPCPHPQGQAFRPCPPRLAPAGEREGGTTSRQLGERWPPNKLWTWPPLRRRVPESLARLPSPSEHLLEGPAAQPLLLKPHASPVSFGATRLEALVSPWCGPRIDEFPLTPPPTQPTASVSIGDRERQPQGGAGSSG